MPPKRVIRSRLVQQLVDIGVEKKYAHSMVGYWLNRWPYQEVALAILSARSESPIEDITNALKKFEEAM